MSRQTKDLDYYHVMGMLDSVHDFKDEPDPVPGLLLSTMKTFIGNASADSLGKFVSLITKQNVTSVTSSYERNCERYLEKLLDLQSLDPDNAITYKEIIQDGGTKERKLWEKYKKLVNVVDIIKLESDAKYSFSELAGNDCNENTKKKNQNILADFILSFFFPDDASHPRITFDGSSGNIGKVFKEIEQMKCVITPLNIADSATTSVDRLNGRVECIFPKTTDPYKYVIESNIYTKDIYNLTINDTGYNNNNMFHFNLKVNNVTMPFSSDQTQGPSISYLSDLITLVSSNKNVSNVTGSTQNILKVGKYLPLMKEPKDKKVALLYDMKRTGDHEQVNAAVNIKEFFYPNMIVCTMDLLCSTFARYRNMPCIFHNTAGEMYLFRFPGTKVGMTADGILYGTKTRAQHVIFLFKKIKFLIEGGNNDSFFDRMVQQIVVFEKQSFYGCFVSGKKKIKATEKEAHAISVILTTQLLRAKMQDMFQYLLEISNNITPILREGIEIMIKYEELFVSFLDARLDNSGTVTIDPTTQDVFFQGVNITEIINQMNEKYNHELIVQEFTKLIESTTQYKSLTSTNENLPDESFEITFENELAMPDSNVFMKTKLTVFQYNYDYFMDFYTTVFHFMNELNQLIVRSVQGSVSRKMPFTIIKMIQTLLERLETLRENMMLDSFKQFIQTIYRSFNQYLQDVTDAIDTNNNEKFLSTVFEINTFFTSVFIEKIGEKFPGMLDREKIGECDTTLTTATSSSVPSQSVPLESDSSKMIVDSGETQTGGSAVSRLYFDANDLFTEATSLAETFLNTQYSVCFPQLNIYDALRTAVGLYEPETLLEFRVSCKTFLSNLLLFQEQNNTFAFLKPNRVVETLMELYEKEQYDELHERMTEVMNQMEAILKTQSAKIDVFTRFLLSDAERQSELFTNYDIITSNWKIGLQELEDLDVYEPNEGIHIVSFLLSYNSYGFDPMNDECLNDYNDLIQRIQEASAENRQIRVSDKPYLLTLYQVHSAMNSGIAPEIIVLFLLCMFNNVMNCIENYISFLEPIKYSRMNFECISYDSKDEWSSKLPPQIVQMITFIGNQYNRTGQNGGGQNVTGQNVTGQNVTGQNVTGQNVTGQNGVGGGHWGWVSQNNAPPLLKSKRKNKKSKK